MDGASRSMVCGSLTKLRIPDTIFMLNLVLVSGPWLKIRFAFVRYHCKSSGAFSFGGAYEL